MSSEMLPHELAMEDTKASRFSRSPSEKYYLTSENRFKVRSTKVSWAPGTAYRKAKAVGTDHTLSGSDNRCEIRIE
ncbi:hypothetical protein QFC19_007461 [Naganishia cerealis]|uniref:Uncharacterized protein n=1 Tax=Naganishia cerealis TaxID=610337 RepID=A0ACC2V9L9_9TREE|nr:hypothetical protein QFC19_007461 [Naganishia cerealis]